MSKPINRNVSIETENGHATGILIAQNFVLTNFHVLETGSETKVNGVPAQVIKVSTKYDLCLLMVPTPYVAPIEFAEEVRQDEEIVIYGNPLHHKGMILHGRIIDIEDGKFYTDAHIFLGSSGSGCWNKKNQLVGMVSAIEGKEGIGFPYAVIIPAHIIATLFEE